MTEWEEYFLIESAFWASKSPDTSTKCGCVLTTKDNTPLSFGYNGVMRGIDHSEFGNWLTTRPDKYDFFIHAEQNAIYNCARNGLSTLKSSAFITGEPCLVCYQALYQCGCDRIVYSDLNAPKMLDNEIYQYKFKRLKEMTDGKMSVEFVPSKLVSHKTIDKIFNKLAHI